MAEKNDNINKDDNDENIAWHPGFVNAMKLELIENEEDLYYETEHLWLTSLTANLDDKQLIAIFSKISELKEKNEKIYAKSVASVVTKANSKSIERLKGDGRMYIKELFEIMKPEIDEAVNTAVTDALSKRERDQVIRLLKRDMSYNDIADLLDITVDEVKKIEEENLIPV